jgi:hypothetical protein
VPQALYDEIKAAAHASGRSMGEEMVWRVARSFEWEKERAFGAEALIKATAQLAAQPNPFGNIEELLKRAGMAALKAAREEEASFMAGQAPRNLEEQRKEEEQS